MESIEDKTLRDMVVDRDVALVKKEQELEELRRQIVSIECDLRKQITSLEGELAEAWKHPIQDDEKIAKVMLLDYEETRAFAVNVLNPSPSGIPLLGMVNHFVDAHRVAIRERDRYASAWAVAHNAMKKADAIANGKDSNGNST